MERPRVGTRQREEEASREWVSLQFGAVVWSGESGVLAVAAVPAAKIVEAKLETEAITLVKNADNCVKIEPTTPKIVIDSGAAGVANATKTKAAAVSKAKARRPIKIYPTTFIHGKLSMFWVISFIAWV